MKVVSRSLGIVMIFYLIMALGGYFSTLNETPDVVLTRATVQIPGLEHDWYLMIAQALVMVVMTVNCVANYMPFRNNIYFMVTGSNEISNVANIMITAIFCSVTAFISIIFPAVTSVLGIFGGFASVNICYLVPRKFFLYL
jgi:hypothetical protein